MAKITTQAYDDVNQQNTKLPIIVLEIEGLPYRFASAQTYTKIRYDDPGIYYDGTYVYDGLRPIGSDVMKNYIDRASSMATISQKLEQWDGRASIETMSLKLVDVRGLITQIVTPGAVLDEILNKKVKVYFGYQNISFPDDYVTIFKGYINEYSNDQGVVSFKFTDPSSKRKQQIFNEATTTLTNPISDTDTTIVLASTTLLYKQILDGAGNEDPTVSLGIVIGEEIIFYENADIDPDNVTLNNVTRGAYNTVASAHDAGEEVSCFLLIEDNPITIALKVMLSGWNGPCIEDIGLRGIINTDDGFIVPNSITLEQGVDAIRDYGLNIGDYFILSGSPNPANNDTFTVAQMINDNRTIIVAETGVLVQENPPPSGNLPTVGAIRSEYDTLPESAGIGISVDDVDTAKHEYYRDTFVGIEYTMPCKGVESSGKNWIEEHLMKTIGGYALTQGSRISMGLTHPPLSTDLTKIIDHTNVIQAKGIKVVRGMDTRFLYNEVTFKYAYDPIADEFFKQLTVIDADAQARTKKVSPLVIEVRGLPDNPGSATFLRQRAQRILLRYRYGAETIELKTKFGTGHTIDAGDIVVLSDRKIDGVEVPLIKIANTETGQRGVYDRVMEVQERTIMVSDGNAKFRLLSNNGFSITDRYAVISPASLIDEVYSTSHFKIKESFGGRFPGQEFLKWRDYQGLRIKIHNDDFSDYAVRTFTLDPSNQFIMILDSPLPFSPAPDYTVELADYDETSADSQKLVKSQFAYFSRTGDIVSGSTDLVFTLDTGQGVNYLVGNTVYVSKPDGSVISPDVKILTVVGDIVTVNASLGFTPANGDQLKLGGFKDAGQSYRYI